MAKTAVSQSGKYDGKMLTLEEAAKYLRMGKSTLYECVYNGSIRHFKPPRGKILFHVDDLDAWLEKSEVPAGTVG